ncbi:hypothetical protein [Oricola sp.]|uniref:hypothetical protein n=1 Tax=Oricola sp. TaxID=1979950 RepID=UPI003512215A
MYERFNCRNGNASAYLARPAERLVLEGYRHWTCGFATGDGMSWRSATELYQDILGGHGSATAVQALSDFVSTLGRCATCPLKTFASGSSHICRDEVLVMGLIAGIQNDDEEATALCLSELSCETRCDEVALAAGAFALVLRGLDKHLIPIPASVLRDILARSHPAWRDTQSNRTLH